MARTAKNKTVDDDKCKCFYCGNEYISKNFYKSNSIFYSNIGKIPYCKHCMEKLYQKYCTKYRSEDCINPEKKAIKRLCMAFDIYYVESVYNSVINKINDGDINISVFAQYMKMIQLQQYNRKKETYENTIMQSEKENVAMSFIDDVADNTEIDKKTIDFFGAGFTREDYKYLQKEYDDWTARHECSTKAQEEVFKRICFKQLEILKATRRGEDTKNLDATFQNLLETAKLQPKQNSGDTTADNQTFGTLIDKWENERPLPEIDEELKDIDKIGFYIDTFLKGHTCKMLNVKNAFSNLYSSMMKKFTVEKPEYNLDEDEYDSELNFDTIFGNAINDSSDEYGR